MEYELLTVFDINENISYTTIIIVKQEMYIPAK